MQVRIRSDSVEIEGYVNAIERNSKPLWSTIGRFVERICAGAFGKAIKRNDDIKVLLNHDKGHVLGSTREGNLVLREDNIGLHARAIITDPEVIEKARQHKLVGWSFGFSDRDVQTTIERGMPLREVRDLDLYEVSILDDRKSPAYNGTLIFARSEDDGEQIHYRDEEASDEVITEGGEEVDEVNENTEAAEEGEASTNEKRSADQGAVENPVENPVENSGKIDYSSVRNMIKEMKEE